MELPASLLVPRRGRPRKFGRPAEPVTITLPDDIVQALRADDPDLSRAIVRLVEVAHPASVRRPPVELTHYGHSAVIVVTPRNAIKRLPGVALVPLPDGRALISLGQEVGVAEFEVMVRDALDADDMAEPDSSGARESARHPAGGAAVAPHQAPRAEHHRAGVPESGHVEEARCRAPP